MGHGLQKRDIQAGIEMAWHKLTQIMATLTPDSVFPWEVILAPDGYKINGEWKERKGYYLPVASDDLLPFGAGVVINVASYCRRINSGIAF